jgi:hypothetical protein
MHGDESSGLGWFAPAYGTLIPTWTARLSRAGTAPLSFLTWFAASAAAPSLARLTTDADPEGRAISVSILQDGVASVTMVRPGELAVRETRCCTVGRYHTDARLLHYASAGGRLRMLAACDAHHALAVHDGWLSIASDASMPDICVDVHEDRIDVWSSSPTSRLRIEGALVAATTIVRLNGRTLPPYAWERVDSVVAFGSDWGEPGRTQACVASPVSQI